MQFLSIITLFIISLTVVSSEREKDTVHLYTHKWCRPCRKATSIISKLEDKYPSLDFKIHNYEGKTVLFADEGRSQSDILPFPSLIFNCSGQKFTYQNDLTVSEVSYWINAVCLHKLTTCTNNINDNLFHIAVKKHQNFTSLVDSMQKYPHIKICQASNANYTSSHVVEILQEAGKKTIFLDYFSHNVRNYLMQSQKWAVALFTNNPNTSRSTSFFGAYMSIQGTT